MTKITASESPVSPLPAVEPGQRRWEGHMSDDVGATFGSGTRGTHRVPRVAITKLGRGKMYPWFFSGIRIRHTLKAVPADLQFKPLGLHWREVLRALRELGYPVA